MKLIVAFILGVIVATVGVTGITRLLDRGVQTMQEQVRDLSKQP